MQVLYPCGAGLDVHKDIIVACVRCVSTPVHQEVRSFPTTTSGLQSLDEWLSSHACTYVVMEPPKKWMPSQPRESQPNSPTLRLRRDFHAIRCPLGPAKESHQS